MDVEKDLGETELQDVQRQALCRGLNRRGPGLICGRRCCLRYGHLCTHRCDEHWDWNMNYKECIYGMTEDDVKVIVEDNTEESDSDGLIYECI